MPVQLGLLFSEIKQFIKSLLKTLKYVSLLIHEARGELDRENVVCQDREVIAFRALLKSFCP
jgi:hypothetical protein